MCGCPCVQRAIARSLTHRGDTRIVNWLDRAASVHNERMGWNDIIITVMAIIAAVAAVGATALVLISLI
jgi:hypothetical protein